MEPKPDDDISYALQQQRSKARKIVKRWYSDRRKSYKKEEIVVFTLPKAFKTM